MCRYAEHMYKEHFACFSCRKAFKVTNRYELSDPNHPEYGEFRLVPCPECGKPMHNMGLDFKAPRTSDKKQWRKIEILHNHGINFDSCGCCGPGLRPATLGQVKTFLASREPRTAGEKLLRVIESRQKMTRTNKAGKRLRPRV